MSNIIWNETTATVKTKLSMSKLADLIIGIEEQAQYELVQEIICHWDKSRRAMLILWLDD